MNEKKETALIDIRSTLRDLIGIAFSVTGLPRTRNTEKQVGLMLLDHFLLDGKADAAAVREFVELHLDGAEPDEVRIARLTELVAKITGGKIKTHTYVVADAEDEPEETSQAAEGATQS